MTAAPRTLEVLHFPLHGSRLIEASAGTGKTWTIAALYLRLVLGHGAEGTGFARPLRPNEILVMTFTRAATRELSDRIRARLLEAAQVFRGEAAPSAHDSLLPALLADHPDGPAREQAAHRLALAAEGMDDAAIHTIDAWCQRMLREHAFDSGSLFDEELLPDESALLSLAVRDYWRQHCYPLSVPELREVLAVWADVHALEADVAALLPALQAGASLPPAEAAWAQAPALAEALAQVQHARQTALAHLKAGWVERAERLRLWVEAQVAPKTCPWDRRRLSAANAAKWTQALVEWAQAPEQAQPALTDAAWFRLSPPGLADAWKGSAADLPALPAEFTLLAALPEQLAALPTLATPLRLHAATQVAERLALLKRQQGRLGFADLLVRLDAALRGDSGERLRQRILTQTPVALIDEFQDTSALQYRLFDRLYRVGQPTEAHEAGEAEAPSTALLLIGDPKQSIYRFRGADIASYLAARQATAGRHYVLGTNHRSSHALVAAVNHCFAQAEGRPGAGAFLYRPTPQAGGAPAEADNPLPFLPVVAQGRAEQWGDAHGPLPALTLVHDLMPDAAAAHQARFAERCAEQLVAWLADPACGFARPATDRQPASHQRLRPADIAVLVRTGREARAVRRALARRGVASVYLSDRESVFLSEEAHDVLYLLRAVAQPLDSRLVRAALATRTLGLSLDELAWLATHDEAFDAHAEQLRRLHHVWQTQGVLTLLRQVLHHFGLPARWLNMLDGERRLTNFLHLAELLQTASRALDGEQALIRWLSEQREAAAQGDVGSDEQVVRLESDADLVKVVTIHKSKGLEYPVVCVPFATSFRAERKGHAQVFVEQVAAQPGAQPRPQLHLALDEALLARADGERLREDLRLLYVALTRARHALWLGFAALTVGQQPASQTHRSAAGFLLTGADPLDETLWGALPDEERRAHQAETLYEALSAATQGCADIQLQAVSHDGPVPVTRLPPREAPAPLAEAATYAGRFDRRWGIASFSSLVRAMQAGAPPSASEARPLAPVQQRRPADDETPLPTPTPDDLADETAPEGAPPTPAATHPAGPVWHGFERGPLAGNFLHDQLEWLAGEGFALAERPALAEALRRRCERVGRSAQAEAVVTWLSAVVRHPLPGVNASLAELERVLPEMEFWLPAERLPADTVDALCRTHLLTELPPQAIRPRLPQRELHGLVMGFADLVVEHQGRFWVVDYKSNHLGPEARAYDAPALAGAMALHRYDVQAALYLLALHRLLRQRLGAAYDPERQLGGALYLFLRGLDGPAGGVYLVPPCLPLLTALGDVLNEEVAP